MYIYMKFGYTLSTSLCNISVILVCAKVQHNVTKLTRWKEVTGELLNSCHRDLIDQMAKTSTHHWNCAEWQFRKHKSSEH